MTASALTAGSPAAAAALALLSGEAVAELDTLGPSLALEQACRVVAYLSMRRPGTRIMFLTPTLAERTTIVRRTNECLGREPWGRGVIVTPGRFLGGSTVWAASVESRPDTKVGAQLAVIDPDLGWFGIPGELFGPFGGAFFGQALILGRGSQRLRSACAAKCETAARSLKVDPVPLEVLIAGTSA